jgi:hypothetical protein
VKTSAQSILISEIRYPQSDIGKTADLKVGRYTKLARRQGAVTLAWRAAKNARAHKGSKVYCESGETSKKLRTHSKRENHALGFESERLTRLFGAGAPFRPLFRPIPSNMFRDRRIPYPTSHSNKNPDE